jgi:tRNA pseudouridine38-40 synthase
MKRWKLILEYDGTAYSGWQRQGGGIPSVQEAVEEAIHGFCQQRVTLHVAGRTDAGVHARGQVAHFDLDYGARPLRGHDLAKAIGAHLRPHPIAVLAAEETAPDFHARFSARSKLYTYRIVNRRADPALDRDFAWHIRPRLNAAAMHEAAQLLLGHHDFTTFRDSDCQAKSPGKTLDALDVVETPRGPGGHEILIHARARSFLHHQVRNMVGTLALVGDGRWQPADVAAALAARDRTRGGPTAPPEGLCLVSIDY